MLLLNQFLSMTQLYGTLNSKRLQRVLRKFLNFTRHALNIHFTLHDYTPVLHFLNLSSLANHWHLYSLYILRKLLSDLIYSPSVLTLINLKVSDQYICNTSNFFIPHCATNYLKYEPITSMTRLAIGDPSFFL